MRQSDQGYRSAFRRPGPRASLAGNVKCHRRPYLPFDGVLVLAEEGLELERLLELLAKKLDRHLALYSPATVDALHSKLFV